jgi:hypothetical protein
MGRSDQFMGLTDQAYELIQDATKEAECGHYKGMFGDDYSLTEYIMVDGSRYQEFLQADPWSGGPVFFIALKKYNSNTDEWDVVEESLWSDSEIEKA